jgi:regulator of sirC expression with transglutaminase-like and TPR domain
VARDGRRAPISPSLGGLSHRAHNGAVGPIDLVTPLDYFRSLVADNATLPLAEAAASIGQDVDPQLDVLGVLHRLDELALRFKTSLRRAAGPQIGSETRLRYFNEYFFRELGFGGNRNDYYHPDNSYLHRVLHTRRGIPISLAVIYVELAQQVGLRAYGVSFPGHFLVKIKLADVDVVLDPFTGSSLSREVLEEWLQERAALTGGEFADAPLSAYLRPASGRDIVTRMLRNLKAIYRNHKDWARLLPVHERLIVIQPDDAAERRDRGITHEMLGHYKAALKDLEWYVAADPKGNDVRLVQAKISALRSLLSR